MQAGDAVVVPIGRAHRPPKSVRNALGTAGNRAATRAKGGPKTWFVP